MKQLSGALFLTALLLGCVGSKVTLLKGASSNPSPVDTSKIKIYADTSALNCSFDYVAVIETQTPSTKTAGAKAIQKAKVEAGEVGANALLIDSLNTSSGLGVRENRFTALYEDRPCN